MKSQRKTAMGAGRGWGGRVFKENRKYREGEITDDWEKGHEFSQRGRHLPDQARGGAEWLIAWIPEADQLG